MSAVLPPPRRTTGREVFSHDLPGLAVPLKCEVWWQHPEAPTRIEPGHSGSVEVEHVWLGTIDLMASPVIGEALIPEVERAFLAHISSPHPACRCPDSKPVQRYGRYHQICTRCGGVTF